MTMTEHVAGRKPGHWYPWIFVAAFGVVVVVNGIMIFFALSTFPGLETENAYDRGVNYNQTLAAMETQKNLGWAAETRFTPPGDVVLAISDAQGQPLDGLTVHGRVLNPTREGQDVEFTMTAAGSGRYEAKVDIPGPGQWQINIYARRGEDVLFHPTRVRFH